VLTLVFMDTLDLDVEQPTGIERDAGPRLDVGGQALLVGVLDRAPRAPKRSVIDMGLESTLASGSVKQPHAQSLLQSSDALADRGAG
jgi:hypothetical protein